MVVDYFLSISYLINRVIVSALTAVIPTLTPRQKSRHFRSCFSRPDQPMNGRSVCSIWFSKKITARNKCNKCSSDCKLLHSLNCSNVVLWQHRCVGPETRLQLPTVHSVNSHQRITQAPLSQHCYVAQSSSSKVFSNKVCRIFKQNSDSASQ